MAFQFNNQLKFIVPVAKGSCRIMTLDTNIGRGSLIKKIREWFPEFPEIVRIKRQNRIRSYNLLPKYYMLSYEEIIFEDGKQKWNKIYDIKAYQNAVIKVTELKTGKVMTY